MKKYSLIITSGIISFLFILITGWISFSNSISVTSEFAFVFHLIPFGIGFTGGSSILICLYYLLLWVGLSLLISPIIKAFYQSKNKTKFLIFFIAALFIITAIIFYMDFSKNKEDEERMATNSEMDKVDFQHLRTGDLLFRKAIETDSLTSDSSYYNIGIAFIDNGNYTLLEMQDQVQYVSIRQWIENSNNKDYTAKRLRDADSLLNSSGIKAFEREASNNIMKKYDNSTNWSDEEMYNAELIWKIYKRSIDIELGLLDTLNVGSIKKIMISPKTIFNSEKLMTVRKN